MQQILLPVVGALVGGGSAMLVSGNALTSIIIGIAIGLGIWLAAKGQTPPA